MNFINLKRKLKLRWESGHIGFSSIPVLIRVFKNRKNIEACIEFENATPQKKTLLEEKYHTHLVNTTMAGDIKANEKFRSQNNPQKIVFLAFDLQKVLNIPSGENGLFYYIHKLLVYNLTIRDLVKKDEFVCILGPNHCQTGG